MSDKIAIILKQILYYKIQFVCVSSFLCVCVCVCVTMFVRYRLPNHAYYGDEAFAGDLVGLGLGQRLNLILKDYPNVLLGQNSP